jgi:hypothetical protein
MFIRFNYEDGKGLICIEISKIKEEISLIVVFL